MAKRSKRSKFHPKVPTMRRHSSGQARVTLSGRTHYLGAWGSPQAHARYAELVEQWEANGRQPVVLVETVATIAAAQKPAEPVKTLRQALAEFEAHMDASGRYTKGGKPTSERTIIARAITEFCDAFGDEPTTRFDAAMLLAHRDRLESGRAAQEARKAQEGCDSEKEREAVRLSRGGINRKVQTLKRALRWLRGRRVLSREQWFDALEVAPLRRGELPAERDRKRPKRAVLPEEVEKVAKHAGRTVGAMLRLQALVGCRPGEVCGLRWQDIDKTPVVVDGVTCWTWNVHDAKTSHHGHSTVYALPPAAQRILDQFRGMPASHVFSPRRAMQERHDALRAARTVDETKQTRDRDARPVRRQHCAAFRVDVYGKWVERAVARAGVQRFTPHEIRHGFVTRAAERFGVVAAATAANHASTQTTQGYLHPDRTAAYRVVVGLETADDRTVPSGSKAG